MKVGTPHPPETYRRHARCVAGPFRSIQIDQYVQAKRNRPSRILLEPLPDLETGVNMTEYMLKLKERTRKNHTIIDAQGPMLRQIMDALVNKSAVMNHMHFIIASYVSGVLVGLKVGPTLGTQ